MNLSFSNSAQYDLVMQKYNGRRAILKINYIPYLPPIFKNLFILFIANDKQELNKISVY